MSARRAAAGPVWQRISADPILSYPPGPGSPGNVGAGQDLRLNIGWDRFEQLLVSVAQGIVGLDQMRFRRYGLSGQRQHGIDLAGRRPDTGDYTVVQCKDYQRFTITNLRAAVRTFASGKRPFAAPHLIIAVSMPTRSTQLEDELATLRDTHSDLTIELWGAEQINDELRSHPEIVGRFWTRETADTFCTGAPLPGVAAPPVNLVRLADQILVGPIGMDGVKECLDAADELRAADPAAAAAIYGNIADTLAEEGFRGHSHALRHKQLDALTETDERLSAATLTAQLAAVALHEADAQQAQVLSRRLDRLDPTSNRSVVEALVSHDTQGNSNIPELDGTTLASIKRHRELIGAAVSASFHPLADTSELTAALRRSLDDAPAPAYQPLLVLFLAEMTHAEATVVPISSFVAGSVTQIDTGSDAIAARLAPLDDLITAAIGELEQASLSVQDQEVLLRLRLVRSHYDTVERSTLLTNARQRRVEEKSAALILASQARREAFDGSAEEAIEHWRQAVASAIHGGHTDDAGGWLYSVQKVPARYGPWSFGGSDEHLLAQALPAASSGRLIRRVRAPETDARRAALAGNLSEAIIAARRWLADSIVVGNWIDENIATELLGDLYAKSTELARAACCYQRAGATSKLRELLSTAGDELLPPVAPVGSGPWWQQETFLVQVAVQHDLLDDDTVASLITELLELVRRGRNGELTDDPSRRLTLQATKTLCALASYGDAADAQALLDLLADDIPRAENQHRRTDQDHVQLCESILVHHPEMTWQALKRIFDLAEVGTDDALAALSHSTVVDCLRIADAAPGLPAAERPHTAITVLTSTQRGTLRRRLRVMAAAGRYRAGLAMATLGETDEAVTERATLARDRLLNRPEPDGNSFNHGTQLVSDSYLVSFLKPVDQQACLHKMLTIAADRRESAGNRQDALTAAANLVISQDDQFKAEVHRQSRAFVTGAQDGSFMDEQTTDPHPLSAWRVNLGPVSLCADGLKLAFNSATTDDDRHWIRQQAIAMLGGSDNATIRRAAHVLTWLGPIGLGDLDATLLAGHPVSTMRELAAVIAAATPGSWASALHSLAKDDDYTVRLVLAQQLYEADTRSSDESAHGHIDGYNTAAAVLGILLADGRRSVRRAAAGLAN